MSDKDLLKKVLNSIIFKAATGKAGKMLGNSRLILGLLKDALTKITNSKSESSGVVSALMGKISLLGRMLKAYISGQYKDLPTKTLLRILASLIYFVSPIDLIPDFLPVLGLSDDLALIVWVMGSINNDIERFEEWEKTGAIDIS